MEQKKEKYENGSTRVGFEPTHIGRLVSWPIALTARPRHRLNERVDVCDLSEL